MFDLRAGCLVIGSSSSLVPCPAQDALLGAFASRLNVDFLLIDGSFERAFLDQGSLTFSRFGGMHAITRACLTKIWSGV